MTEVAEPETRTAEQARAAIDEVRATWEAIPQELRDVVLAEARVRRPEVRIVREPLVYERHTPTSYFRDRALAELNGDQQAMGRLQRHAAEMDIEMPRFLDRVYRSAPDGLETRVNPSRVDGQGGYFSPPLWANEYFATAPRAMRVLAGMIPNFALTAKVSEVKLPRILGQGTSVEGTQDTNASPDRDFTDAAAESWVESFRGQSDCSMQLLEQSPAGAHLDFAILKDMLEDYDETLEEALFTGAGKSHQQIAGILNLATGAGGVSKVEATGTKGYEIWRALGKVAGQLGDARRAPPEVWLMRTARWAYIGSEEDESKLPLAVPGHQAIVPPPFTFDDTRPAVAPPILGWPNYLSDAIPVNINGNQDVIVCARPTDSMLFETPKSTMVDKETLSGTLQARFMLHGYAAALFRYPTGLAYLTGAALKVESEY